MNLKSDLKPSFLKWFCYDVVPVERTRSILDHWVALSVRSQWCWWSHSLGPVPVVQGIEWICTSGKQSCHWATSLAPLHFLFFFSSTLTYLWMFSTNNTNRNLWSLVVQYQAQWPVEQDSCEGPCWLRFQLRQTSGQSLLSPSSGHPLTPSLLTSLPPPS